ncbi:MAG: hypothetical protein JOY62_08390 [Acidobacteriaceae bacterium]|nr:hypothetical protein [Acidobacteriaceae bacterium]MBV9779979.1 hypothetical protein [Acidobacteriaceae bacterium]
MPFLITKRLVVGATFFGGLLAGVTANRALVQLPAWGRTGLTDWARFANQENLGLGPLFYSSVGLAALLFTVAAAIASRFDRAVHEARRFPIYSAAVVAILWAGITRFVLVPAMSHVNAAINNPTELKQAFLTVTRWSAVNDALHVLTFVLTLWGFVEIFSRAPGSE